MVQALLQFNFYGKIQYRQDRANHCWCCFPKWLGAVSTCIITLHLRSDLINQLRTLLILVYETESPTFNDVIKNIHSTVHTVFSEFHSQLTAADTNSTVMAIYSDLHIMIILTKVTKTAAGSESDGTVLLIGCAIELGYVLPN